MSRFPCTLHLQARVPPPQKIISSGSIRAQYEVTCHAAWHWLDLRTLEDERHLWQTVVQGSKSQESVALRLHLFGPFLLPVTMQATPALWNAGWDGFLNWSEYSLTELPARTKHHRREQGSTDTEGHDAGSDANGNDAQQQQQDAATSSQMHRIRALQILVIFRRGGNAGLLEMSRSFIM